MKKERFDLTFDSKYDVCSTCPNRCDDYENYYSNPERCKITKTAPN